MRNVGARVRMSRRRVHEGEGEVSASVRVREGGCDGEGERDGDGVRVTDAEHFEAARASSSHWQKRTVPTAFGLWSGKPVG